LIELLLRKWRQQKAAFLRAEPASQNPIISS